VTFEKVKEIKGNTWQSEHNISMTLVKEKERKCDSHESKSDTCEYNGMQKRQFRTLTKIEVQSQPR